MIDLESGIMVCNNCDKWLEYSYYTVEGYGENFHFCECCAEDIADKHFNGDYSCIEEHDDAEALVCDAICDESERWWF